MERKNLLINLSLCLLLAFPVLGQARIYKWYDENGKVHYSQSPPPKGSQSASINTDTFSSMEMRKVPKSALSPSKSNKSKRTYKRKVKKIVKKKRTTRSSTCPLKR
ncbi:MAG: DUF4124 domain-containing protein [Candidatus Thiodiazotropha sp. DIVDIV]